MANQSRLKSDKLRAVEDGLRQLQAKDRQIKEQIQDEIKLDRACEVRLLKQEIKNLEKKNKAPRKTHQGNSLLCTLAQCNVVEW
jgi:hypothetical protein